MKHIDGYFIASRIRLDKLHYHKTLSEAKEFCYKNPVCEANVCTYGISIYIYFIKYNKIISYSRISNYFNIFWMHIRIKKITQLKIGKVVYDPRDKEIQP